MHKLLAVIYNKRGKVLSMGTNSYLKTHPLQASYAKKVGMDKKIFLHAEIDAISKCRNIQEAYRIQIVRKRKDGSFGKSKPCPICAMAIYNTPIVHVDYYD